MAVVDNRGLFGGMTGTLAYGEVGSSVAIHVSSRDPASRLAACRFPRIPDIRVAGVDSRVLFGGMTRALGGSHIGSSVAIHVSSGDPRLPGTGGRGLAAVGRSVLIHVTDRDALAVRVAALRRASLPVIVRHGLAGGLTGGRFTRRCILPEHERLVHTLAGGLAGGSISRSLDLARTRSLVLASVGLPSRGQ